MYEIEIANLIGFIFYLTLIVIYLYIYIVYKKSNTYILYTMLVLSILGIINYFNL